MRDEDWDKLCRNIYEGKCILFLGSEFPLEDSSTLSSTTFSKLLSGHLKTEIRTFEGLPPLITTRLEEREFSQLACDYLNFKSRDKQDNRLVLENSITRFLNKSKLRLSSPTFTNLAELPFTIIVNTNYTSFFSDCLTAHQKTPGKSYYHFRGKKIDLAVSANEDDLGTKEQPFVYNLFGSTAEPASLVLSENDLVQFVINLVSKNPGLPANVKSGLADQEKCFLFLGFGFLAKNWYFRILLQALESNNKGRMSYALERLEAMQNDEDPTVLFFRDELKLRLYQYDQGEFVDMLTEKWQSYLQEKEEDTAVERLPDDAPRVFVSYKSEDFAAVDLWCQRLKHLGIDVWLDKEKLSKKWRDVLHKEIDTCDAFVLMQSKNMKEKEDDNFVYEELRRAMDRANRFKDQSDFLFPCCIDDKSSMLDIELIKAIQNYDLSKPGVVDKLASEIKRTYARLKNKQAA